MITETSVGIDYHERGVQVCVMSREGRVELNRKVKNDIDAVVEAIGRDRTGVTVVAEACNGSATFLDQLHLNTGWPVRLCHPGYAQRMRAASNWYRPTFICSGGNSRRIFLDVRVTMRRRRMLRSKKMYDLCFRSLRGLPLPARALTTLLIESIMGRILCSEAVIICGYVWMSNHLHMQVFSLDCSALTRFHERLKKRLTDFLKRLLNLSELHLWDNRTTLGEVLDLQAAIDRIVYTYLNPVRAGLVRSIDEYRGCNTWKEFIAVPADVNASVEREVPWILATDIESLSQENPSLGEEQKLIKSIESQASQRSRNIIRVMPLKWLEAFGMGKS